LEVVVVPRGQLARMLQCSSRDELVEKRASHRAQALLGISRTVVTGLDSGEYRALEEGLDLIFCRGCVVGLGSHVRGDRTRTTGSRLVALDDQLEGHEARPIPILDVVD